MKIETFVGVGENIHCTRVYKVDGRFVKADEQGAYFVHFDADGQDRRLPVPEVSRKTADWEAGRLKHCAAAIWQGMYGDEAAGVEYLQAHARRQEAAGATYLDINVDEFSMDLEERAKAMTWTTEVVQKAVRIPMSIDTSSIETLRAGLEACDLTRGRPMVNSVSLERADAIPVAADFNAVIIASAAGEKDLPTTTDGRLANLAALMPRLEAAGFKPADIHIDPLVFPISTDGGNGKGFLESVTAIRGAYGLEIHIVAGLSNISFGMPNRKLINQVFTWLAVEAGADGGIVDPVQINVGILNGMDLSAENFQAARALLMGEDEFGMDFITAAREGRL